MSYLSKKNVGVLLDAGFAEEDLGLIEGGIQGVEIYESPNDYFAKELIENACEQGLCSLADEILPPDDIKFIPYDNSHKPLYHDQEYAGNDDLEEDIPINLRDQARFIQGIKLGRISVWQRQNKNGIFEWQVKELKIEIPEEEKERFDKMSKEYQKIFWLTCAKDEWKKLWEITVESLRYFEIEGTTKFKNKKGLDLNLLIIPADNIRKMGYNNLPSEARWVTMIYFEKSEDF